MALGSFQAGCLKALGFRGFGFDASWCVSASGLELGGFGPWAIRRKLVEGPAPKPPLKTGPQPEHNTIGALIIRIGSWDPFYSDTILVIKDPTVRHP